MGLTATLGISFCWPLTRQRFPHANSPPDVSRRQMYLIQTGRLNKRLKPSCQSTREYFSDQVSELFGVNNPGRAAAAARSSSSPLPACHLQQHGLRSRPPCQKSTKRQRQRLSSVSGDRLGRQEATVVDTTRRCANPVDYLQNRPRRKMSPVSSLGKVVDSHNPQRVEISERASAARGAMPLLESREQNLLTDL